jgi:heme o synthase
MNKASEKNIRLGLFRLTKPIITLSVAFSALTGFILFSGGFSSGWFSMYLGVLLTAAGSSVINHIQEARTDRMMERTRSRPLPSGQIGVVPAIIWATFLAIAGPIILWWQTHPISALLAVFTLFWYNVVYTSLKKITPWAIIPGAVVGAIPPVIGWTAAGGSITHPNIVFIAFFFFIGQIPHFWLILLRYGKDYENAGFPSISKNFSPEQISRLTFTWTTATAMTAILLSVFGIILSHTVSIIVIIMSIVLIAAFYKWPGIKKPAHVERAFIIMNIYFLLMMILIIADAMIR